jgi:hypothetical protein
MKKWLLALPFLTIGCSLDTGKSQYCDREYTLDGELSGSNVSFDDYQVQAVWFNSSVEERLNDEVGALDIEIMEEMGLDPDSNEDILRYKYWIQAYDLRFLFIEQLSSTDFGALGSEIGRDLGFYFFDLNAHEVQPGTEVAVFDISSIEPLRDSGDTEALGNEIRNLVDTMQNNGQPDLIVAYSPDRSGENVLRSALINIFSANARFASSGSASFQEILDAYGDSVSSLGYPPADLDSLGLDANIQFNGGQTLLEGEEAESLDAELSCAVLQISG